MHLDYLLYDNRTPGPSGHDWGLKVATGALEKNRHIRRLFVEYCRRSFNTRVQTPRNFGAALGGIPIKSDGYLLCVTLELQDRFHRPACGFVGIYCSGRAMLRSLLENADPMAMARSVYENDGLPTHIGLRGSSLLRARTVRACPARSPASHSSGPGLGPFKPNESPGIVADFLRQCSSTRVRLPAILGIASWISKKAHAASPDQIVFYQNLPAELARQEITTPGPKSEESFEKVPRHKLLYLLGGTVPVLIGLLVVLGWIAPRWPPVASETLPLVSKALPADRDASPSEPGPDLKSSVEIPADTDSNDFLARVQLLVTRLSELDPAGLRTSAIYEILEKVEVLPEHEPNRSAMIELLETGLSTFRNSKFDAIAYYFGDKRGRQFADSVRDSKVREHLIEISLPIKDCHLLKESFRLLMSHEDGGPASWCAIVEELATEQTKLRGT